MVCAAAPQEPIAAQVKTDQPARHQHVQTYDGDGELPKVIDLKISSDGKFMYSAGFGPNLTCFTLDPDTGMITDHEEADSVTAIVGIDISPDDRLFAVAVMNSRKLILYSRNPQDGSLTEQDSVIVGDAQTLLNVIFSPDGKYLYASDNAGVVHAWSVANNELNEIQKFNHYKAELKGAQFFAFSPDAEHLLLANRTAGTIVAFKYHADNGQIDIINYFEDDIEDATAMNTVQDLVFSPDGRYIYAVSGRFTGENGVTVVEFPGEGEMKFVQQFQNEDQLEEFVGGNLISISPDGKHVYVSAARSHRFAVFSRNSRTGKLTFIDYLKLENSGTEINQPAGSVCSIDGRFLYVAGEGTGEVHVFKRP